MKTPEGWAKANLLLKTLQAPPQKGSLRESVLILLLMKLETIEHARFRALAQIIVDQKKGVDAFEEYMKIAFPYLEIAKSRDKEKHIEMLKKEVGRGPLAVKVLQQPVAKSRLKQRMISRTKQQSDKLYNKLGGTLPI